MAINYIKTKQQILSKIVNALEKNAGVNAKSSGSISKALAEALAVEIGDIYEALKFSVDQTSLGTASGRSLDSIGDLYGVYRRTVGTDVQEERYSFNIEFSISAPQSANVVIPNNTIIYNDVTDFSSLQYQYTLTGDVVLMAGTTRAYGRVVPNFSSGDFTASKGTLTRHNFSTTNGLVIFCTNPKEVYSMVNMETDDMYRRRIIKSIKGNSFGTAESMRLRALSVSGVRDVRVRESSYGLGSCDVIVVPESQRIGPALVQDLFSSLAVVKPVGIKLNIRIAERVPVSVAVSITLPSGLGQNLINGIENQVNLFVKNYLNSNTIGDSISFGDLESQVRSASDFIKSVSILSVSSNGQEIPKGVYRINDDRQYIVAGTVSTFSVIMSSVNY